MPRALATHTDDEGATRLSAGFARHGERTVLASKFHTSPVKIAKTFETGGELAAIVMDASPGMLAGDRYAFDWRAAPGSRVFLTNQSYTKIHPAPPGRGALMRQSYAVGEGACVQAMMEPVMLYRDAEFTSVTEVSLAEGAVWYSADILSPGRLHRGESFAFRRYDAAVSVTYGGELIFRSRLLLEPDKDRITSPGAWEDRSHYGMLYVFSDRLSARELDAVREAMEHVPGIVPGAVIAGASRTFKHGLVVTAGGHAAWQLQRVLHAAWQAVRMSLDGLPPFEWTASR